MTGARRGLSGVRRRYPAGAAIRPADIFANLPLDITELGVERELLLDRDVAHTRAPDWPVTRPVGSGIAIRRRWLGLLRDQPMEVSHER